MSATFSYRAFGLNICSELECTGALPGTGAPDVYVHFGAVPEQLENATASGVLYQAAPDRVLLNIRHVARFLIWSGSNILIDMAPGGDEALVLLLLFGSAFGALLHQRGILAIHGSAIATRHGAAVFAGASGYGKSTIAGAFQRRGFDVLADDVCPVDNRNIPTVLPGNPFLMLWADAVNQLNINGEQLRRARSGLEKYIVPLGSAFASEPVPLRTIYILEPSNSDHFGLVPTHGLPKVKALSLAAYRPHFIDGMKLQNQHFRLVCDVARQVKVAVVKRPRGGFRIDELVSLLAADFA